MGAADGAAIITKMDRQGKDGVQRQSGQATARRLVNRSYYHSLEHFVEQRFSRRSPTLLMLGGQSAAFPMGFGNLCSVALVVQTQGCFDEDTANPMGSLPVLIDTYTRPKDARVAD